MAATRRSLRSEIAPEQRRDEIIAILAAGLVRLIGSNTADASGTTGSAGGPSADVCIGVPAGGLAGVPLDNSPSMFAADRSDTPASALASMSVEKPSESLETGLELSRETRLSVVDG